MHIDIIKQLTAQIKAINEMDISTAPSFKVMVYLRNKLVELGLDKKLANRTVAAINVQIPVDFDDETMIAVYELTDEMALLAVNAYKAAKKEFDSDELFIKLLNGSEISFT